MISELSSILGSCSCKLKLKNYKKFVSQDFQKSNNIPIKTVAHKNHHKLAQSPHHILTIKTKNYP